MKNQIRLRRNSFGWQWFNPETREWLPISRLEAHTIMRNIFNFK